MGVRVFLRVSAPMHTRAHPRPSQSPAHVDIIDSMQTTHTHALAGPAANELADRRHRRPPPPPPNPNAGRDPRHYARVQNRAGPA
jgi:hypothetical protein